MHYFLQYLYTSLLPDLQSLSPIWLKLYQNVKETSRTYSHLPPRALNLVYVEREEGEEYIQFWPDLYHRYSTIGWRGWGVSFYIAALYHQYWKKHSDNLWEISIVCHKKKSLAKKHFKNLKRDFHVFFFFNFGCINYFLLVRKGFFWQKSQNKSTWLIWCPINAKCSGSAPNKIFLKLGLLRTCFSSYFQVIQ